MRARQVLHSNPGVEVSAHTYILKFKFPFRLAHGTRTQTEVVVLNIRSEGFNCFGEASLPPYLGVKAYEVIDFYAQLPWAQLLDTPLSELSQVLDQLHPSMNAAKAAIDIALHDLNSQRLNLSIEEMLGLKRATNVASTFTLGMSLPEELPQKLLEASPFKIIKLKLGGSDDKTLVDDFLNLCDKPFCVDVNQGWYDLDYAAYMCGYLKEKGVEFIEQPLPVGREKDSDWLRKTTGVHIVADESVKRLTDLDMAADYFDGVNIKLMKSTGIAEAHQMIQRARELGLKVVLGAMAESSCGVTAAAQLSSLADWVDLDGPVLTQNDPFAGITFRDGYIVMPKGPGLGAKPLG